jgi:hypothetical protein
MGDLAIVLALVAVSLTAGLAATSSVAQGERRLRGELEAVAAALGLQGDLRRVPRGLVIDGFLLGRGARLVGAAGHTRLVVVVIGLPRNVSVVALHKEPTGPRMLFPEATFNDRVAARGEPAALVGLLAPPVRAALAAANATVTGPPLELEDGLLRLDLTKHLDPSALRRAHRHLGAVVAALSALPPRAPGRLRARVEDPREALDLRARALRLALARYPGDPDTEAAVQAALLSHDPTLVTLARAGVSQEALQGSLSLVGGDDAGALSEVEGPGGLSFRPPPSGRGDA